MHRCKEIHVGASVLTTFLSSYLANMSLQYKLLVTRSRQCIHKELFSYFSKKMFAVDIHCHVNDSFTLSRSIICDQARDEYPQLFFVKYTESVSTIRRRTPTLFKCYSLIFDRIRVLKFSNYSRRSCEQCRL